MQRFFIAKQTPRIGFNISVDVEGFTGRDRSTSILPRVNIYACFAVSAKICSASFLEHPLKITFCNVTWVVSKKLLSRARYHWRQNSSSFRISYRNHYTKFTQKLSHWKKEERKKKNVKEKEILWNHILWWKSKFKARFLEINRFL